MDDGRRKEAGGEHPLLAVVAAMESALDEAQLVELGSGVSALSHEQLREVASRSWRVVQRIYGSAVLPVVAEADERRLFRVEQYASASSMRDLIAGWLRCDPAVAGRLLYTAKHCVSGGFRETGAALATGEIDLDHATETVRSVRGLPAGVMQEADYRKAESTMVDVARSTDAKVTKLAGRGLLEVVAPDAAEEHADRQAERERQRAEASRWFEVTGVGIAGAKEIRLRAECEVIDSLMRVLTGLVQPSPVDAEPDEQPADDDPAGDEPAGDEPAAGDEQVTDDESVVGGEQVVGEERGFVAARAVDDTAPPGGAPGAQTEGGVTLAPIERRRADAAVEVIDAVSRPDLLDDLTGSQLRHLADLIDTGSSRQDDIETGPGRTEDKLVGVAAGSALESTGEGVDPELVAAVVDAGQVTVDDCEDNDADRAEGSGRETPARSYEAPAPMREADDTTGTGRTGTGATGTTGTTDRAGAGRAGGTGTRPTSGDRPTKRVRAERPTLVIIANYDHDRARPRAGEASSSGAPARLVASQEVERVACDATVTPVWMTNNTTPVTVAASTRFFRGKQLAALIARDRGCAFPNCSRGLRYGHAHHIVPWSESGPTSVDNGVIVCGHHHRELHRDDGWTVRLGTDGLPEFIPPYWIDPQRRPQRHTRYWTSLPYAA